KGLPLEWRSPSGFPVSSAEYEPNIVEVKSLLRGERVRYRVGSGYKDKLKKRACLDAAAPNFVHSLDAAHMVSTINNLVGQRITAVLGIHDCFGGLAPDALDILRATRAEFDRLYKNHNWLKVLCGYAESNVAPPDRGSLAWFNPK